MVVTGQGDTIDAAQKNAVRLADRVFTPNIRYRREIGARLLGGQFARLERLGIFGERSGPAKQPRKRPRRSVLSGERGAKHRAAPEKPNLLHAADVAPHANRENDQSRFVDT
jgi:hypothetical protein